MVNETNNRYQLDPIESMRYVWYYRESNEKGRRMKTKGIEENKNLHQVGHHHHS
jgi:hypothetical protein